MTPLARKLWRLRQQYIAAGGRLLSREEVRKEVARRRGAPAERMRRTYLDSGVLIELFQGRTRNASLALRILNDPQRVFLSCPFLDFELLPQAVVNRRHQEYEFYKSYLSKTERCEDLTALFTLAFQEASRTICQRDRRTARGSGSSTKSR